MRSKLLINTILIPLFLLGCDDSEPTPQSTGDPSGAIIQVDVTEQPTKTFTLDLGVYVVDGQGAFVPGLTQEHFQIESIRVGDNDSLWFRNTEVIADQTPNKGSYSATLLLDQSKSTRETDPQNHRIQASRIFGQALGEQDYVSLASFSAHYPAPYVRFHTDYTQDTATLNDGLDKLLRFSDGGTPLFQAVDYTITHTTKQASGDNRAIVLFTDGQDTEGGVSLDQIIDRANKNNIQIYTVGLSQDVEVGVLSKMAQETGGAFIWAENARQLISGFGTLGNLLSGEAPYYQTQWEVTTTSSLKGTGAIVVVDVVVALPNDDPFIVPFEVTIP